MSVQKLKIDSNIFLYTVLMWLNIFHEDSVTSDSNLGIRFLFGLFYGHPPLYLENLG